MEHVAILTGKRSAGHGEGRIATCGVSGHGLVNHDGVHEGCVAVALGVVCREVAIGELDGVQTLNTNTLGEVGDKCSVSNVNLCRGVDGWRTKTV